MYIYTHIYTYTHMHMYIFTQDARGEGGQRKYHRRKGTCVCTYVYTYVHMYIHTCTYICTYVYIYTYIYTYPHPFVYVFTGRTWGERGGINHGGKLRIHILTYIRIYTHRRGVGREGRGFTIRGETHTCIHIYAHMYIFIYIRT